jgi:hypothetical protein
MDRYRGNPIHIHRGATVVGTRLPVRLNDSASFTPQGRRLLVALGIVTPDPLRVQAEQWLAGHRGPMTEAVREVRKALGPPIPDAWLAAAEKMRACPWKGPLA